VKEGEGEVKESDIFAALASRHPAPEWAYLPQVRTRTGYSRTFGSDLDSERYLDAFAMNCYRGKGYRRVGYEIKVSRSDWLRELEDPRKRAQGYFLCHEFWFALAPGVYKPDDEWSLQTPRRLRLENPLDGCGVIEVAEDGALKIVRKAVSHDAWPMPDTFVASLMRSYVTYLARREQMGGLAELLPSAEASDIRETPAPLDSLWVASGE